MSKQKIEQNTKEILEKIEELNKKQGLTKKKKPNYFHFPFSYSRSQEERIPEIDHFKFPTNPYQNPILDYLNNEKTNERRASEDSSNVEITSAQYPNPIFQYVENGENIPVHLEASLIPFPKGISILQTNPNAEITEADKIPGQYIKRKITHQQTVIVPSIQTYMDRQAGYQNQMNEEVYERPASSPSAVINQYITNNPMATQKQSNKKHNKVSNLEKQTVNNIKNIIFNAQPNPSYYNPYSQQSQSAPSFYSPYSPQAHNIYKPLMPQMYPNIENANVYGPYIVPNLGASSMRQFQFQSPLQDYFPVIVKDPLVQLFNALTTMIEYGPQAGGGIMDVGCKKENKGQLKSTLTATVEDNEKVKVLKEVNESKAEVRSPEDNEKETFLYATYNDTNTEQYDFVLKNITADDFIVKLENSESRNNQNKTNIEQYDFVLTNSTEEGIILELEDYGVKNQNNTNIEQYHLVLKNSTGGDSILKLEDSEVLYDRNNKASKVIRSPKVKVQVKLLQNDRPMKHKNNSNSTNNAKTYTIKENRVDFTRPNNRDFQSTMKPPINSPPFRDHRPLEDEYDNEDEKGILGIPKPSSYSTGEDIQVSHDGNKKLFSKDNTGSGIFIHKLKVRRGGVAIAGPGGIATAGEGGTAIVGPNGYAYTQPDSLAIAGTGTKVIAVEPSINLGELIKNNHTRIGGPNPHRIGKVVAVGPVIYYNKG